MVRVANLFRLDNNTVPDGGVPDCIKILVSEMASLGESLVRNTINKFSIVSDDPAGKECYMIELDALIEVIIMFKYNFHPLKDRHDLRCFIINNSLIALNKDLPKPEGIYLNVNLLIDAMKLSGRNLGLNISSNHPSMTLTKSFLKMGHDLLKEKIISIVKILRTYKTNCIDGNIDERDLRRILLEHLGLEERN